MSPLPQGGAMAASGDALQALLAAPLTAAQAEYLLHHRVAATLQGFLAALVEAQPPSVALWAAGWFHAEARAAAPPSATPTATDEPPLSPASQPPLTPASQPPLTPASQPPLTPASELPDTPAGGPPPPAIPRWGSLPTFQGLRSSATRSGMLPSPSQRRLQQQSRLSVRKSLPTATWPVLGPGAPALGSASCLELGSLGRAPGSPKDRAPPPLPLQPLPSPTRSASPGGDAPDPAPQTRTVRSGDAPGARRTSQAPPGDLPPAPSSPLRLAASHTALAGPLRPGACPSPTAAGAADRPAPDSPTSDPRPRQKSGPPAPDSPTSDPRPRQKSGPPAPDSPTSDPRPRQKSAPPALDPGPADTPPQPRKVSTPPIIPELPLNKVIPEHPPKAAAPAPAAAPLSPRAEAERARKLQLHRKALADQLHNAVAAGQAGQCLRLIDGKADLTRLSGDQGSVLLHAARAGLGGVCNRLLDEGVDVHVQDKYGGTALIWAAYAGLEAVCRRLLAEGADPTCQSSTGRTALAGAAAKVRRGAALSCGAPCWCPGASVPPGRQGAPLRPPVLSFCGVALRGRPDRPLNRRRLPPPPPPMAVRSPPTAAQPPPALPPLPHRHCTGPSCATPPRATLQR